MTTVRPMMTFTTPVLRTWTPDLVNAAEDPTRAFAEYVQQTLGVPWPTQRDMVILRKKVNDFFELYPQADYRTLCRVVVFMRSRKRRVSRMWMVVEEFRKAWAAGQLPELDPGYVRDDGIKTLIEEALTVETDPVWRRRLLLAQGPASQREVYVSWQQSTST